MQDTQDKVKAAQDQAAATWAKWSAANDACREAYYAYRGTPPWSPSGYAYGEAYARYTEACQQRDSFYAKAVEDAEDFWRQDCTDSERRAAGVRG